MTWALSNPCEGANGVAVDTTNSAVYGDALTPQIGSGATVAYSTAQVWHGSSAISFATGASAVNANVAWTVTASATVYFRAYIRTPSSFATAPSVVRIQGGGSQAARVTWNAAGNLLIRDSGNTTRATSTTALSVSTWYRLEGFVTQGATGTAEIKIWSTPDGPLASPTETLTAASFNYGTVNLDTVTFGQVAVLASLPTWYVDDLWATDFGYVGPAQQPDTTFILPLPPWALLIRPILPWYWSRSSLVDAPAGPPGPVPFSLVQSVPGRAAVIPAPAQFIHPPLGGAAPSGPVPFALAVPLRGHGRAAVIPKAGQFVHPPLGSPAIGQPFLPGTLDGRIAVEIAWGADLTDTSGASWTWTDVTSDVMYAQRVSITQGRSDETSQANPATCGFTLLNSAGDYTAYSPTSQYYPNVRRSTPVRVRVDPGDGGGPRVRFQGYAAGFTPGWDPSANRATVTVSAAGVLRRLTQGKTPLRSAVYRAAHLVAPVAAWPMDDGSNSTHLASSIIGVDAMSIATSGVTLGVTDAALPGATANITLVPNVIDLPYGGQVIASVSYANTGFLAVRAWHKVAGGGGVVQNVNTVAFKLAGSGTLYRCNIGLFGPAAPPAGVIMSIYGTTFHSTSSTGATITVDPTDGDWHETFLTMQQNGADIDVNVYLDGQLGTTATVTNETLNPITSIWINGYVNGATNATVSTAMLALYTNTAAAPAYGAGGGWAGETADTRLLRLCAEQEVPITVSGTSAIAMGPQTPATFVALLRECEGADAGLLYDGFGPGLGYVCRSNRYNESAALTLDMATDPPQVANPFAPVDDDQRNRNDITASRTGGSSARFIDQTGPLGTDTIGVYDSSVELNVADDTGLLDQASWRVHLGTIEGLRYPTLPLDLLATPSKATDWLAVTLTGRVDVTNVTSRALQHPPDDLSLGVEGWSENLGTFTWAVTQNCSPQSPWSVGIVADAQHRVETDGSTLAADITTTAASASVASSTAYIWTTTAAFPADFPFDIEIGGERITVTAIVGSSSPQTFTLTRSVNGVVKAHSAGNDVSLWHPAVIAL